MNTPRRSKGTGAAVWPRLFRLERGVSAVLPLEVVQGPDTAARGVHHDEVGRLRVVSAGTDPEVGVDVQDALLTTRRVDDVGLGGDVGDRPAVTHRAGERVGRRRGGRLTLEVVVGLLAGAGTGLQVGEAVVGGAGDRVREALRDADEQAELAVPARVRRRGTHPGL